MTDPSTPEPIDGDPWPEWTGNEARRCVAFKKTGEQCRRHARRGTTVCDFHGAKAPQVQRKARQRLEEAADRMAKQLLGIAEGAESEAVKLAAVKHVLAIGGLSEKNAVDVSVELKPYEQLLQSVGGIAQISRAESHERRGLTSADPDEVVDAEVVPEAPDADAGGRTPGDRADDPTHRPAFATDDVGPPGNALMTMEEATAGQARYISSQRIHRRR